MRLSAIKMILYETKFILLYVTIVCIFNNKIHQTHSKNKIGALRCICFCLLSNPVLIHSKNKFGNGTHELCPLFVHLHLLCLQLNIS